MVGTESFQWGNRSLMAAGMSSQESGLRPCLSASNTVATSPPSSTTSRFIWPNGLLELNAHTHTRACMEVERERDRGWGRAGSNNFFNSSSLAIVVRETLTAWRFFSSPAASRWSRRLGSRCPSSCGTSSSFSRLRLHRPTTSGRPTGLRPP